jgi:hypothetical protein
MSLWSEAMINGRHIDCTAEEHHAREEYSNSMLKYLPHDPELFWGKYIADPKPAWAKRPFKTTRDMELGTAFHGMLLENEVFPIVPRDILSSDGSMTTKAAKQFKADFPNYLKQDENDDLTYAVERCKKDPEIMAFLDTKGKVEHTLVAEDESTGLPTRGRLDRLCWFADGLWVFDVKFSGGTCKRWVEKQMAEMGYYRAGPFYADLAEATYGIPVVGVAFLFVRNKPPFDAALWKMSHEDIDLGRRHNAIALADLASRLESWNWFGTTYGKLNPAELPRWKREEVGGEHAPYHEFVEFETE